LPVSVLAACPNIFIDTISRKREMYVNLKITGSVFITYDLG